MRSLCEEAPPERHLDGLLLRITGREVNEACQELNACQTRFPGARLRLHFAVATPDGARHRTIS